MAHPPYTDAAQALGPLAPLAGYRQWTVSLRSTKAPVNCGTLRPHDATDPANWIDWKTALERAAGAPAELGAGFALADTDPFVVLDVDGALLPDGKTWHPIVAELCDTLRGTVCELSQSGRGLHFWGRGEVPPNRKQKVTVNGVRLELYSRGHYVMLGHPVKDGAMADTCPGFAAIAARYFAPDGAAPAGSASAPDDGPCEGFAGPDTDETLVQFALAHHRPDDPGRAFGGPAAKATFRDLYECNESVLARVYPSPRDDVFDRSSADMAMASHLAYYTWRDRARIERIMRGSKLMRDKWDGHATYLREDTIRKACIGQQRLHQWRVAPAPAPAPTMTYADAAQRLLALPIEAIREQWLPLVLQMGPADEEAFINHHHVTLGVGVRAMKAAVKQARDAERKRASMAAIAERQDGRTGVQWRKEASTEVAAEVERLIVAAAAPGEYVVFGGTLSQVTTKALPKTHQIDNPDGAAPPVPQIEPLNDVALLALAERECVMYEMTDKGPRKIGIPDRIVANILGKSKHAAPVVAGLLTHPIVDPSTGQILTTDGLHVGTGMFLMGAAMPGLRAYSQAEAQQALHRLRAEFLEGFEFASALDTDMALAGLFTGVQRRLLDAAPGLAAIAHTQSSGKTTLIRKTHIVLTGHDMPATTYPPDPAEFQKTLLSLLMRGAPLVCFDNLPDGTEMRSSALAAAMTSASLDQRVLGSSRNATPMTNTLFAITGNNLSLGPDEASRWMVCRLAPRSPRPEERSFRHHDVVAHGLQIRGQVLRDVVGIVAGYLHHAQPGAVAGSRFPMWSRVVREPLRWAGAEDVAAVFRTNADSNPEGMAHGALVLVLRDEFRDGWFSAGDVNSILVGGRPATTVGSREALAEALDALAPPRSKDARSAQAIGLALKSKQGRVADIDGSRLQIVGMATTRKVNAYRIEPATE